MQRNEPENDTTLTLDITPRPIGLEYLYYTKIIYISTFNIVWLYMYYLFNANWKQMRSQILAVVFACGVVPLLAQSSLSKAEMQFDTRDYYGAIESYMDVLHTGGTMDETIVCASIAQCYVQLQDNLRASQWHEKVIDDENLDSLHWVHVAYARLLLGPNLRLPEFRIGASL